jgi:hypothetical protein
MGVEALGQYRAGISWWIPVRGFKIVIQVIVIIMRHAESAGEIFSADDVCNNPVVCVRDRDGAGPQRPSDCRWPGRGVPGGPPREL